MMKHGPVASAIQYGALSDLDWLAPLQRLDTKSGAEFGRKITDHLNGLGKADGVVAVTLRKQSAAVVMTTAHYEQLIQMKDYCEQLEQEIRALTVGGMTSEFDHYFNKLTSNEAAKANQLLLEASPEDLANSYKPGGTETHV